MADAPAPGEHESDEAPDQTATKGPVSLEDAKAARAAKIAAYRAGVDKAPRARAPGGMIGAAAEARAAKQEDGKPESGALVDAKPEQTAETQGAAKLEAKEAKSDEDDTTARGIAAIEKRDKRQREMLKAERAKHEAELAEREQKIAAREAAVGSSAIDDLKKLPAARRAIEALKLAGINPDDEDVMEVIARDAYARSKSGKADPKNRAYAEQVAAQRSRDTELDELRKSIDELRQEREAERTHAQVTKFQQDYLDAAVKAIPKEPSFIGLAHGANAARARSALLELGQRMEREAIEENGGRWDSSLTPSHAEVIARYEREKRQAYKDDGLTDDQIAAMLKSKSAAAALSQERRPPPTLDITQRPTTPTINGTGIPSREQKIEAARQARLKRNAEQLS